MINYHELLKKEFKYSTPNQKKKFILENKELIKKWKFADGYSHRWNLYWEVDWWLTNYCKNLDYKLHPVFSHGSKLTVEQQDKYEKMYKLWDDIRVEIYTCKEDN